MGVTGAAVATTIGRGIGVLYQLTQLRRPDGRVVLHRNNLKLVPDVLWSLVKLSGTGTFQVFIATASYVGLVRVVSTFGSTVLAGYTIGIRLVIFVLLPSWGLANAAATMVGQSLGAGKPERAERSVYLAGYYNLVVLGAFSVIFIAFAGTITSFFTNSPDVAREAVLALRTIGAGLIFYAYGMVLHQSFNGAGDTWTPTVLNIICFWVIEIPAAWFLSRPLGEFGVYLAFPLAESLLTVSSLLMFRRGKWKLRKV
jgi:Na+-driven multidrug efflux pump